MNERELPCNVQHKKANTFTNLKNNNNNKSNTRTHSTLFIFDFFSLCVGALSGQQSPQGRRRGGPFPLARGKKKRRTKEKKLGSFFFLETPPKGL